MSEGGFCHQFMLHVFPYHPLQPCPPLTVPLPNHLRPPHAHLFITLTLPHHLFTPNSPLYNSFTLPLSHNLIPAFATLSLSISNPLPHPPYLSQRLTH